MIHELTGNFSWNAQLLAVLFAVSLAGFVRGFTGFGSALIIIPALTLVFGPKPAVAMHAIIEIPVVLTLAPAAIRHADRSAVLPMLAALAVATPIGALVLRFLDPEPLKIVISIVVLGMVALLTTRDKLMPFLGAGRCDICGNDRGINSRRDGHRGPTGCDGLIGTGRRCHNLARKRHRRHVQHDHRFNRLILGVRID